MQYASVDGWAVKYILHSNHQVLRLSRGEHWPDNNYWLIDVLSRHDETVSWNTLQARCRVTTVSKDMGLMCWQRLHLSSQGGVIGRKHIESGIIYEGKMEGLLAVLSEDQRYRRVLHYLMGEYL